MHFIYAAGRVVTVAGQILGSHTDTVGERVDGYPLLGCSEIYLWPQATVTEVLPSLWLWWEWDPWYRHPWSWRPPQHHWRHWRHYHHRR